MTGNKLCGFVNLIYAKKIRQQPTPHTLAILLTTDQYTYDLCGIINHMREDPQRSDAEQEALNNREIRDDFAGYLREFIIKNNKPYKDELFYDDNDDLDKISERSFIVKPGSEFWPMEKPEDLYMILAQLQSENNDLILAFSRNSQKNSITFQVSLAQNTKQ